MYFYRNSVSKFLYKIFCFYLVFIGCFELSAEFIANRPGDIEIYNLLHDRSDLLLDYKLEKNMHSVNNSLPID